MSQTIRSRAVSILRVCGIAAVAQLFVFASLPAQTPPAMPDSVRDYVSTAMAAFRSHSVHRGEVDWGALEDSVLARAAGARTPAETWPVLTWALRRVDRHSFLMPPEGWMAAMSGDVAPHSASPSESRPLGRLLDDGIGLVAVPPHAGRNRPAYVDSLRTQLLALDGAGVCGWVVDLRENTGGNMWPMLAGIGPLLGAELVGSFTANPPGVGWRYRDGRSWFGGSTPPGEPLGWGSTPVRRLTHADAPVALLVGGKTSSSGEMLIVAFQGRPDVRSFGDSTAGFASANTSVQLRDGATMLVTSAYPRDRLGRTYPLQLTPDEVVPLVDRDDDAVLRRALAWLRRQPACAVRG